MTPFEPTPSAWLEGFKQQNARVREHAGRSKKAVKERDMDSIYTPNGATGLFSEGRTLISPSLASEILAQMNYERQRRVEAGHIAALAVLMSNGQWTQGTSIAFARLPTGRFILIDGQHRLCAIVQSGIAQEFMAIVHDVSNEREVDELYYRFDTVSRRRSKEQIVRASGIADQQNIRRTVARGAYEAGVILACGLKRLPAIKIPAVLKTPDGKFRAIAPYWPPIKLYNDLTTGAEKTLAPRLVMGSVMAVAAITLRDQPSKAIPFWKGVADNDGLHKGDPRRALVSALLDRDLQTPGVAITLTVNAWNAWFSGRRAEYLKNTDVEPKLAGCRIP